MLAEAGISIPDEQEDEVEKFREFLDQISPEDFEGPARALEPVPAVSVDLRSNLDMRSRVRRVLRRAVVDRRAGPPYRHEQETPLV